MPVPLYEIWCMYDDSKSILVQQKHHFPVKSNSRIGEFEK